MKNKPNESVKDFVRVDKTIKLDNGMQLLIKTPTLGWWFDFVFPKYNALQFSKLNPELLDKVKNEYIKHGKLSEETISMMPMPIREFLLDIVVDIMIHQKDCEIGVDSNWVKENLTIVDFMNIINTLLQVAGARKVFDFFVSISQQIPMMGLMLGRSQTQAQGQA